MAEKAWVWWCDWCHWALLPGQVAEDKCSNCKKRMTKEVVELLADRKRGQRDVLVRE